MEDREQAEKLFLESMTKESILSDEDQGRLSTTIRRLIRNSLSTQDRKCRFKYREFMMVIMTTAVLGRLVLEKASEAFENLEKYFILLYRSPWKKEFRTIKTFCGFFQSKIRSHLEEVESIFSLVGFRKQSPGALTLGGEPDRQLFLSVAFECVVATVECELLSEYHLKMKGSSIEEVVRWRYSGEEVELKKMYDDKRALESRGSDIVSRNLSRGANNIHTNSVYGYGGEEAGARSRAVPAVDLPYIDDEDHIDHDEYIEGTIDDHVMASMKRLSHSDAHARRPEVLMGHSNDWDYVRVGLEGKYGEKYYDGTRGNIIVNQPMQLRPGSDSDEGIDVAEAPPPVQFHSRRYRAGSDMRTSGYHTTSTSQVFYPPAVEPGQQTLLDPVSQGIRSSDTAYGTQTSYGPIARGADSKAAASGSGLYKAQRYTSSGAVGEQMIARNMNDPGFADKGWSCATCTLNNSPESRVCASCSKSRTAVPDMDGPHCGDSTSECRKCTYENQPGESFCKMCGNPLDKRNVHTYV